MNIGISRNQNNTIFIICFILLLILSYFPIFWRLDATYLRLWDESRLAMNALEMSRNGNLIVTYFKGAPDMWNTKPPFMIWFQALSIKIFGINELAVRLPAAIAALLTVVALFVFCARYLKNNIAGLLSGLILATTQGYIYNHGARHGEYDAMLVLFLTLGSIFFFIYAEAPSVKIRYLYLFTAMLFLGIMTKGIAACMFLPALFLYALFTWKIKKMLLSRHLYINIISLLILVFGYYFLRESLNPGYIDAVLENEIFGRYLEVNEGHVGGFWFYFHDMLESAFIPWIYFLVPAFILLFFHPKSRFIRLNFFLALWIVSFFLIISNAETKLWWYSMPIYPIAALLVGISFGEIAQEFAIRNKRWTTATEVFLIIAILAFLLFPYINILKIVKTPVPEYSNELKYRDYIRDMVKHYDDDFIIANSGYNAHLLFYQEQMKEKNEVFIINTKLERGANAGDKVIVCEDQVKDIIKNNYNFTYFHRGNPCETFLILSETDTTSNQNQ